MQPNSGSVSKDKLFVASAKSFLDGAMVTGRYSAGLIREFNAHVENGTANIFPIFDEIGALEGAKTARPSRAKTCFDIAQALAIRHLRERHDAKLFTATETADANIAAIARDDSIETRPRHEIHNLRKQRPAKGHGSAPRSEKSGKLPQNHQAEFKSTPNESSSNVLLSKDYPSYPVRLTGQ